MPLPFENDPRFDVTYGNMEVGEKCPALLQAIQDYFTEVGAHSARIFCQTYYVGYLLYPEYRFTVTCKIKGSRQRQRTFYVDVCYNLIK